jgi:hypothetical protein
MKVNSLCWCWKTTNYYTLIELLQLKEGQETFSNWIAIPQTLHWLQAEPTCHGGKSEMLQKPFLQATICAASLRLWLGQTWGTTSSNIALYNKQQPLVSGVMSNFWFRAYWRLQTQQRHWQNLSGSFWTPRGSTLEWFESRGTTNYTNL